MHENRETSGASPAGGDRSGKANNHKPDMNAPEESHDAILPMKPPNKEAQASAEGVEGRASIEENSVESSTRPTPSGERVSQGLGGVRRVAWERKQERFTALLHHLTVGLLRDSYYALKRNAAPGVDGLRWSEYEDGLEGRLIDLHGRVHRGAYRAQPSRRGGLAQTPVFWGLRCPEGTRPKEVLPREVSRRYTVQLYADLPSHLQSGRAAVHHQQYLPPGTGLSLFPFLPVLRRAPRRKCGRR